MIKRFRAAQARAHRRGVQIQVILDKRHWTEQYSSADFLVNQGMPTMVDAERASSHHQVMVIDSDTVTMGSLTFTKAAQAQHAASLLIIRDTALATPYTQNWQAHPPYSQPYVGRGVR